MPIKLVVGKNYIHKTLGLVKLLESEHDCFVRILTDKVLLDGNGSWRDDWDYLYSIEIKKEWFVKTSYLTTAKPAKEDKGKSPVQIRCRKLWNDSNWVKQHPDQAY